MPLGQQILLSTLLKERINPAQFDGQPLLLCKPIVAKKRYQDQECMYVVSRVRRTVVV